MVSGKYKNKEKPPKRQRRLGLLQYKASIMCVPFGVRINFDKLSNTLLDIHQVLSACMRYLSLLTVFATERTIVRKEVGHCD